MAGGNVYDQLQDLIGQLNALGLHDHADELQNVMGAGATGTEIFMSLRWHLGQIQCSAGISDDSTAKKIDALLMELDTQLGSGR
jgi:hypothetical protein